MNATGEQAKRCSEQRSVVAVALNISLSSQQKKYPKYKRKSFYFRQWNEQYGRLIIATKRER